MNPEKLVNALLACGAIRRQRSGAAPFALKSGATSDIYVDVRRAALMPETTAILSDELFALLNLPGFPAFDSIGCDDGPGPMVLLGALLYAMHRWYDAPSGFVRRKAPKAHGTGNEIEGIIGQRPIILEDVITTGGSVEAIVRAIGRPPAAVICAVDRREAGVPPLPYPVYPLLSLEDIRAAVATAPTP